MSKLTASVIAVLVLLVSVQTWRLRDAQEAARNVQAVWSTQPAEGVVVTRKPGVDTPFMDSSPAEQLLRDTPKAASENSITRALDALITTGEDSKQAARVDTETKSGKRMLAKLARAMQKHGGEPKDKLLKKGGTEAGRQISSAMRSIRQGDYASAMAQLQTAEQAPSLNAKEYKALAQAYSEMGMPDEALRTYQDWSNAHPDDAQAYLNLARAYESLGMNSEAAAQLALYQDQAGNSANAFANSAALYRRLGMTAEEGALLTDWVGASPTSTQAHMAMADYYRRTGNLPSALSEYQSVLQTSPGNVSAHMNLAQTYQQMGQYAEAQATLLSALELQPGNADLYLRLGEAYRRSGDVASAINTYQSVVSMEPGTTQALRAQQQITRLQRQAVQAARPQSGS